MLKTNVIRKFDQKKISYKLYDYSSSNLVSGKDVANYLNINENQMFKTLVTVSNNKKNYVFLVPVSKELDLKKAAKVVNEKKIEMILSKNLLPLTGYIHGGCSPVGMKKNFTTIIDESSLNFENIIFNAGKIGYQIEVSLNDLKKIINFEYKDIC